MRFKKFRKSLTFALACDPTANTDMNTIFFPARKCETMALNHVGRYTQGRQKRTGNLNIADGLPPSG
jgi:hypothetical protein